MLKWPEVLEIVQHGAATPTLVLMYIDLAQRYVLKMDKGQTVVDVAFTHTICIKSTTVAVVSGCYSSDFIYCIGSGLFVPTWLYFYFHVPYTTAYCPINPLPLTPTEKKPFGCKSECHWLGRRALYCSKNLNLHLISASHTTAVYMKLLIYVIAW